MVGHTEVQELADDHVVNKPQGAPRVRRPA